MPKRVNLPGADELFGGAKQPVVAEPAKVSEPEPVASATKRSKHDEKITVYLSSQDLIAIEQARLQLKADFGLKIDRGRLVRESIEVALRDLAENGAHSALVASLDNG